MFIPLLPMYGGFGYNGVELHPQHQRLPRQRQHRSFAACRAYRSPSLQSLAANTQAMGRQLTHFSSFRNLDK
jgi:hypothetical protein